MSKRYAKVRRPQPNNRTTTEHTTARTYRPDASPWRIDLIKLALLGGAFAVVVYDATVSHAGFVKLGLEPRACLVFAGIIGITQLAIAVLNALGDDVLSIKAGSGMGVLDGVWGWVVAGIYCIDIASNAVAFGIGTQLGALTSSGWLNAGGNALLVLGLSALLTFADELCFRLYDKIEYASRRNRVYAQYSDDSMKAHQQYLAGRRENLTYVAYKQGGRDAEFIMGDGL